MLDSCLSRSSAPSSTCVASPSRRVETGAQTTVENRESMRACRLTTAKTRDRFGSAAPGRRTRKRSPRLKRPPDRQGRLPSPGSRRPLNGPGSPDRVIPWPPAHGGPGTRGPRPRSHETDFECESWPCRCPSSDGDTAKLVRRIESDVKALFAYYRHGVHHGHVRLRWGLIDEVFGVDWALPDDERLHQVLQGDGASPGRPRHGIRPWVERSVVTVIPLARRRAGLPRRPRRAGRRAPAAAPGRGPGGAAGGPAVTALWSQAHPVNGPHIGAPESTRGSRSSNSSSIMAARTSRPAQPACCDAAGNREAGPPRSLAD